METKRYNLDDVVRRLQSPDAATRQGAVNYLAEWGEQGIDEGTGTRMLRAATLPFAADDNEYSDPCSSLVRTAGAHPRAAYVPIVVEVYPKLNAAGKRNALFILVQLESRVAAEAYMRILREHARRDGGVPDLAVGPLRVHPRHPDVFFPELFGYCDDARFACDVYLLCLAYLEEGLLRATQVAPVAPHALRTHDALRSQIRAEQDKHRGAARADWLYDDDGPYAKLRHEAGVVLDLMGHLPPSRVKPALGTALTEFVDPRLRYFAAVSLLRHGADVDPQALSDIAASAEMRTWLFRRLQELNKLELFPKRFATQEALAESEMVQWLCYPTELGRPPDEIELMRAIPATDPADGGVYDTFLFRFRTFPPHWAAKDGWMAGVAGPFKRDEQPTATAHGGTFSTFSKWDSKTPQQHVEDVERLLSESWKLRAAEVDRERAGTRPADNDR